MTWQDVAVGAAGVMGSGLAVAHGFVMQRLIIRPLDAHLRISKVLAPSLLRLIAPLLHVSTLAWFLGGLALIGAAFRAGDPLRPLVILVVGLLYLHAALLNAWATRGRHFGWVVMAVCVALLAATAALPNPI